MLPRLMFVFGMTIGVMAPIIWAEFTSVPTLRSHEDRTARGEPNSYTAPRSDHTPFKSEKAKKPDTVDTRPDTNSFTNPPSPPSERGSAQVTKPALPQVQGPKPDWSTAASNHSNAPIADDGTSGSGEKNHEATDERKDDLASAPSSPPSAGDRTLLSSSEKSNDTAESNEGSPASPSNAPLTGAAKATTLSERQRATVGGKDTSSSTTSSLPPAENRNPRSSSESSEGSAESNDTSTSASSNPPLINDRKSSSKGESPEMTDENQGASYSTSINPPLMDDTHQSTSKRSLNANIPVRRFDRRRFSRKPERLSMRHSRKLTVHHRLCRSHGGVIELDKGFCSFGSYLACTHGTCWRFCY